MPSDASFSFLSLRFILRRRKLAATIVSSLEKFRRSPVGIEPSADRISPRYCRNRSCCERDGDRPGLSTRGSDAAACPYAIGLRDVARVPATSRILTVRCSEYCNECIRSPCRRLAPGTDEVLSS